MRTRRWRFRSTGCSIRRGDLFPPGTPRLQGLTLVRGEYEPLAARLTGGARTIRSRALGLDLRAEGKLIRFRDPVTGEDVRHQDEGRGGSEAGGGPR